jgi:hypothetical protein
MKKILVLYPGKYRLVNHIAFDLAVFILSLCAPPTVVLIDGSSGHKV